MTVPRFESEVKALFRERDQRSMKRAFDLWSYDDVKEHADAIYDQVESGGMPCDEPWPADQVTLFKAWMDGGFPA